MSKKIVKALKYQELREQGHTCQQIADMFGCTKQNVHQLTCGKVYSEKPIDPSKSVFPNFVNWMNNNRISRSEFLRMTGKTAVERNLTRFKNQLSGKVEFKKSEIDAIIKVTGMTYEELFCEDSGGDSCD